MTIGTNGTCNECAAVVKEGMDGIGSIVEYSEEEVALKDSKAIVLTCVVKAVGEGVVLELDKEHLC